MTIERIIIKKLYEGRHDPRSYDYGGWHYYKDQEGKYRKRNLSNNFVRDSSEEEFNDIKDRIEKDFQKMMKEKPGKVVYKSPKDPQKMWFNTYNDAKEYAEANNLELEYKGTDSNGVVVILK